ncbi:unnamed protein product [Echinostoma caproni]|uniref:RNA-directed DNA polymerase from mobile element jockey n=1 Tax=Echinostoma caproni TaxID=27848 RepID=A0A183A029_9TREM|nr:unnamed protein product [Echinostoma caproni]
MHRVASSKRANLSKQRPFFLTHPKESTTVPQKPKPLVPKVTPLMSLKLANHRKTVAFPFPRAGKVLRPPDQLAFQPPRGKRYSRQNPKELPVLGPQDVQTGAEAQTPNREQGEGAVSKHNSSGYPGSGHPSYPKHLEISGEQVLKCMYTNCLSLGNKVLELRQKIKDVQPHILALTETWLSPDILDAEVKIDDYTLLMSESNRGRAGGAAIYLSQSLPPVVIVPQDPIPMIDTLWANLSLSNRDSVLLDVIYRSPTSDQTQAQALLNQLRYL